jgi:hypothetical protein
MILFVLFLLFFISPFLESHLADILVSVFLFLLLVAGTSSVTNRKTFRAFSVLIAGIAMVTSVLHQIIPNPALKALWNISAVAYFSLLIYVLLRKVFRDGPVTGDRVRGAIAVYLLVGLTWSFIYHFIALVIPGAFSVPASLTARPGEQEYQATLSYFSFVTMTTLGYGDVVPVSPVARVFVIIEALIGQLYPATLLARLVSLEIAHRQERQDSSRPDPGTVDEE